ncbi:unnamed protein product [Cuscuta campestris]|uniref:DUF4283 domain-containing protein n=1 Tax=Cuscuta campestris TaxID=132261 RepID=A0A484LNR6_9ASTE|nr:unnamed protein product [Cuscuta campestris]
MELQAKISHVNVPESSSKGFDTPQILNTGIPVEHVDIEDVTDEEFPPLNCPAPKTVPQTFSNLHSNTHEHYITAFRTYVKHLLSLGKTEEAIEVALKYSPKSIQTPLLVESEKSADLFVEPDKSVALIVEPEKSTGGIANSTVKKNTVTIGWRGPRHVILTFSNSQDCTDILLKSQIAFNGANPMRLFRWTPDFNTETETSIASVWISLPGLPIHFFDKAALALGCKPLGKEDEGFYQSIEYERIPLYCSKCFKQGHSAEKCKLEDSNHFLAEKTRKGKNILTEDNSHQDRPERRRSRSRGPKAHKQTTHKQDVLDLRPTAAGPSNVQKDISKKNVPQKKQESDVLKAGVDQSFQMVQRKNSNQKGQLAGSSAKEASNTKLFPLNSTIGILPKSAQMGPSSSHTINNSNSFAVLSQPIEDLPTLNPQAPEFNPTQYTLGVLKEVPLQSMDQNPQNMSILFPVIPTSEIPKQLICGENTLANTIPSNSNVMLEEIDPGPQTAENAIEEVWSDEGYASPIGEEDSFCSPVFDPKSKKLLNDISLDVPAANTRKGSSKAKPPKPPTTKKGAEHCESTKKHIGFSQHFVGCSGKIWLLWKDTYTIKVLSDEEQVVFVDATHTPSQKTGFMAFVYAKTKSWLRKDLWASLVQFTQSYTVNKPWAVVGDFNCSLNPDEKKGGLPMSLNASWDFQQCINDCGLMEVTTYGNTFTWWNGRRKSHSIWKRLDRCLVNQSWADTFQTNVHVLSLTTSDHSPLHISTTIPTCTTAPRKFYFLNAWTTHADFMQVVEKAWKTTLSGPPMVQVAAKLKATTYALNTWNKQVFGNIFTKLEDLEKKVQNAEELYQADPSDENLINFKSVEASYIHQLHLEELFWRQKAHIQWIEDGDRNSKFFHSIVKDRRRRLYIHKIKDQTGAWIEDQKQIAQQAIEFYQHLFTEESRIEPYITWRVYDASLSFWWDNWTGLGPLARVTNQAHGKYWQQPLKENLINSSFNFDHLQSLMDPGFFIHFQVDLSSLGSNNADQALWQPKSNGVFSMKAVKDFLRPCGNVDIYLQNCWHTYIPFKMSFLGWRLLLRKLPLDSTLQKFGYVLPSKCSCCTKPTCETTEHVFAQSEVAKTVWKYFCGLFGLNEQGISTVKQYLNVWWGAKSHPKKYTDAVEAAARKWPNLRKNLSDWKAIFNLNGHLSSSYQAPTKMWQFPPPNSVKINVSMFSKEHQFGTGVVVRDSKGIFLYAYGSVGHASALGATMDILLIILQWCLTSGSSTDFCDGHTNRVTNYLVQWCCNHLHSSMDFLGIFDLPAQCQLLGQHDIQQSFLPEGMENLDLGGAHFPFPTF